MFYFEIGIRCECALSLSSVAVCVCFFFLVRKACRYGRLNSSRGLQCVLGHQFRKRQLFFPLIFDSVYSKESEQNSVHRVHTENHSFFFQFEQSHWLLFSNEQHEISRKNRVYFDFVTLNPIWRRQKKRQSEWITRNPPLQQHNTKSGCNEYQKILRLFI